MSVYKYKKYKISLRHDSKKTQGLRTGDVVRRQYFDGKNLIYSLMCVLSYGTEEVVDSETNEIVERSYFIGALLDGDAPQTEEILDFARMTSLFDTNRSGALYLTGSDEQSPYMDIIDGIGRDYSLCWPENIATADYADSESQYVVVGTDVVEYDYLPSVDDHYRVVHIKRDGTIYYDFVGLQQDFYKYVENPNRVLVSYKIKATKAMTFKMSLGYQDDTRTDGEDDVAVTTDWQYKLHAITVDYSGRYLRTFKLDMEAMSENDEVWVADFNIILLSSISNFGDASKMRVGKLTGVNDPVFGTLDGYGAYMQKLFASRSAHISGTLTAGDENGFAATFYAGKIHRNVFVNSTDIDFVSSITIDSDIDNPTGMGYVYSFDGAITMNAQTSGWYAERVGKQYTFSFWLYAKAACQVSVLQNDKVVGTIQITSAEIESWARHKATFELQAAASDTDSLTLALVPEFTVGASETGIAYFTAPQLEAGEVVTQYQPTDAILNYTEDYGAWFNRGGIGGTIQNPLLQLNYDGEGSIGTRTKSIELKQDGSGHLANNNIKWDKQGDVTFGKNVTMTWDNLDSSVKDELVSKSIRITGADTFTLLGDMTGADPTTSPADITLTLEEENIQSTSSQRQWYYQQGYDWVAFDGENGKTLTLFPFDDYWDNANSLTVKCIVEYGDETYSDTFTVRKQYIMGYTIEIVSSKGQSFKNNDCETVLTANVYYQGKLVDADYVAENYTFRWRKYHLPDLENEVEGWADAVVDADGNTVSEAIDVSQPSITLDYAISGQDYFTCELLNSNMFPYEFPLIF